MQAEVLPLDAHHLSGQDSCCHSITSAGNRAGHQHSDGQVGHQHNGNSQGTLFHFVCRGEKELLERRVTAEMQRLPELADFFLEREEDTKRIAFPRKETIPLPLALSLS